ncbi:MAG: hypothetical protein M3Q09_02065 [Gemmatimonadota bacterium]|nr:hypothetical protein [Gemmatimonadota bacterium]
MRRSFFLCALATIGPVALAAQATPTPKRDSAARADSVSRADSIALVRELEQMQASPQTDTSEVRTSTGTGGPSNPRLIPDISAIGDVIADFSPKGSTQEGGRRFDIREVELALSSAVDPYFRADFILGISDLEGIAIEEAYITATALPWQTAARIGRFHMPFGKQNTTHRAELQTIAYPHVIQNFLGPEGSKGTGLWFSKVLAPFGFYQELLLTAVDNFVESDDELLAAEPSNKDISGLGYSARLRNYLDLSESTNLELSGSAATMRRAQAIDCDPALDCLRSDEVNAVNARQTLIGADLTFRWRPLQQGLYKSFILQAEVMRQVNERSDALDRASLPSEFAGPRRDATGLYVFSRYQMSRRTYVGARYDWVQDPFSDSEPAEGSLKAASAYLQFFPSEFSKLALGFERQFAAGDRKGLNRLILQSTFAVGPHRPHPF